MCFASYTVRVHTNGGVHYPVIIAIVLFIDWQYNFWPIKRTFFANALWRKGISFTSCSHIIRFHVKYCIYMKPNFQLHYYNMLISIFVFFLQHLYILYYNINQTYQYRLALWNIKTVRFLHTPCWQLHRYLPFYRRFRCTSAYKNTLLIYNLHAPLSLILLVF